MQSATARKSARNFTLRKRRYHVTNAEVGAPLNLPFALSNVPCSQDDTAISLSTEVAGYGFGEWLDVCRLQEALPPLWSPPRKVACSMTIWLQENRDITYSVTRTFGVHRMDLVNDYPYNRDWIDRLETDGICFLQRLEALHMSL